MSTASPHLSTHASSHANATNGAATSSTNAQELFVLTDEQILEIAPDVQDVEVFGGERSDRMDPLREDLDLLATSTPIENGSTAEATSNANTASATNTASTTNAAGNSASDGEAPAWLVERMNDPQIGTEARALWDGAQSAQREASAFREVFAKPEDARAAAERARTLGEIDRAYFGAPGCAPEQVSASRAQLAASLLREDPAAFREMVFAGLRALENASKNGASTSETSASAGAAPATTQSTATEHTLPATIAPLVSQTKVVEQQQATQQSAQQATQESAQQTRDAQLAQDARLAAYASFERAANEDLERVVGGAVTRTLQEALPNAAKNQSGAALQERLSAAIRLDVEKALQGDRALGEQLARILASQRLDHATRAQLVRLIGDRAQQLVPVATRRVLADWTQTTLSAHGARGEPSSDGAKTPVGREAASHNAAASHNSLPSNTSAHRTATQTRERDTTRDFTRDVTSSRDRRRFDYRQISDEQILDL